jgi:sugar phosphate isomerase/epimerase
MVLPGRRLFWDPANAGGSVMTGRSTRRELLAVALLAQLARIAKALPLSEIKLGVTTDEIDDDVQAAAAFLESFHLKWAEIRNIWGKYNTELPVDKSREARRALDARGVRVSIADSALFRIPLPPDTAEGRKLIDNEWTLLEAAIERARTLGTDKIRVFGFRPGTDPDPGRSLPRIYELLGEAARRAKQAGVRLAVENLEKAHIATGAQAADLLKHVKDDNLGLTWDPNNAAQSGEQAYPDGYRKLDPARIFHVHLRDYRHEPDGKVVWVAVGDGEFDNLGQIRALLKDGYRETFSLETHWRDPKGKAWSSGTSLKGLLKVIDRV